MDKITPFQIILSAVFGVSALVGLFIFANFQGFGGSRDQVGSVVIWGTLPTETMEKGLQELTDLNKDYGKIAYVERSPATFSSDLANALASGVGPDLIIISQEMLQSERAKLSLIPFSSIPQRTFLDSFLPIFEVYLTPTGTYGIPFVADPLVLYYNRPMLASAGVVSAPTTWEAVTGLAPAITKRTDAGAVTRSLIALGEYGNVRNARAILSTLLLQAGSPITRVTEQGVRSTLADESGTYGTTPAQSAVNFYAQFADPAKTTYSWNRSLPDSRTMFTTGDLALYPGFASERAFLSEANPNLDFDMAPIPAPGTLENRVTYGLAYAFAFPKAAGNAAGAYLAALALADVDISNSVAQEVGMAPARRSLLRAPSDEKYSQIFYQEALISRGWLSPAPLTTDGIFSAMIGDITTGKRSVEQAVNVASQALTLGAQ